MTISQVRSADGTLAVEVRGDGPLIVASPGIGEDRSGFALLAEELIRSGFRVAVADLRGHGESSSRFESYGDEATARDLIAVVEHLGGGPALLVGASMSAAAAVIAAGRRPDLAAGLVLIGPFLRNGTSSAGRLMLSVALLKPWGPAVWRYYASTLWPGLPDAKRRARELTRHLSSSGRWAAFRATAATNHDVVAPWLNGRIEAPALVVMGEQDPDWKDPAAEARWAAAQLRNSSLLMVPRSGHAPMLENADVTGPAVRDFARAVFEGTDGGTHGA